MAALWWAICVSPTTRIQLLVPPLVDPTEAKLLQSFSSARDRVSITDH